MKNCIGKYMVDNLLKSKWDFDDIDEAAKDLTLAYHIWNKALHKNTKEGPLLKAVNYLVSLNHNWFPHEAWFFNDLEYVFWKIKNDE